MTIIDLEQERDGGPGQFASQGPQHAVCRMEAERLAGADDGGRQHRMVGIISDRAIRIA